VEETLSKTMPKTESFMGVGIFVNLACETYSWRQSKYTSSQYSSTKESSPRLQFAGQRENKNNLQNLKTL